ncbi:hypothetical protein ACLOJK_010766 [Asimina triloba]
MTGASLGLRTGSYGSLQQQAANGVVLPIQTAFVNARKHGKLSLPGSRDKDKFLPWICKITVRRKVGMFFLLVFSGAIFTSVMSAISKEGPDIRSKSSQNVHTAVSNGHIVSAYYKEPLIAGEGNHEKDNESHYASKTNSVSHISTTPPFRPAATHPVKLPLEHPCKHFAFLRPQVDRKRIGPRPCPVCYLPVEQAMAFMPAAPSVSPLVKNLTYITEENSSGLTEEISSSLPSFGGSPFGGYPSLEQRNDSFNMKESMNVHCGFIKGDRPGHKTGFDIDDADLFEMEQCQGIVVASAIFGNYDVIQQPTNISEAAKKNICFYMFLDQETEAYMKNSSILNGMRRVGLWRIIIVRNLPYADARRNGKVPKLLLHRIFPNARFSLWIDGKLKLVVDPYQILERFLWRENANFAISRHYRRFDVFEEAEANKIAGKYDNSSIDYQIEFYKREGLTHYSPAKLPVTSDVPEGCVIIREHIPITNLFTCLWFNEVDRFTSRDQISFSTVRDKIMSRVNWTLSMFMDCERRNFVVQSYHREVLEYKLATLSHRPPASSKGSSRQSSTASSRDREARVSRDRDAKVSQRKIPTRRGKDKRSGSRRHRMRTVTDRESNSFKFF